DGVSGRGAKDEASTAASEVARVARERTPGDRDDSIRAVDATAVESGIIAVEQSVGQLQPARCEYPSSVIREVGGQNRVDDGQPALISNRPTRKLATPG